MKDNYRYKGAIMLIAAAVLLWAALWLIVSYLVPQYYFAGYWSVPALFLLLAVILGAMAWMWVGKLEEGTLTYEKVIKSYMIWKGVKMGVCIAAIFVYRAYNPVGFFPFLVTIFAFYILFLILETITVSGIGNRYGSTVQAGTGTTEADDKE